MDVRDRSLSFNRGSGFRVGALRCELPTLTVQSSRDDADINVIVERFGISGTLPQVTMQPITNAIFEGLFDFQSAQNALVSAQRAFDDLPAKLRARFENNPALFVDFCTDKENLPELRRLGLAPPAPDPVPSPPPAGSPDPK